LNGICEIVNVEHLRHRLQAASFISMGSSIVLAERCGPKTFDLRLGFDHAKISCTSVPGQSLSRIGDAAYAGTAQKPPDRR
jgi:hypothetical protein